MGIDYYMRRTDDWQATCVGSVAYIAGVGGGLWAFQFRSPTVCPEPVVITFSGVGGGRSWGGKLGVSSSESTIDTNPVDQKEVEESAQPSGFIPIQCDRKFSIHDLNGSGGRLSVAEGYLAGLGGALVIITAFDRGGLYFNSQEIIGSGVSPTKFSAAVAVTFGIWKSQFTNMIRSRPESKPAHLQDQCSIYDLPESSRQLSLKNYADPRVYNGPQYRAPSR